LYLTIAGGFRVTDDIAFDFGKPLLITVAKDRHHKSFVGTNGDTNIIKLLGDNFVPFDPRVDFWYSLKGVSHGLGKEGHESELKTVSFNESILIFFSQFNHRTHVDFVKGRQHGGFLCCGDEALSDFTAER
jgi:hypothetical protein